MKQYRYIYTHDGDGQPSCTETFEDMRLSFEYNPTRYAEPGTVRLQERTLSEWRTKRPRREKERKA